MTLVENTTCWLNFLFAVSLVESGVEQAEGVETEAENDSAVLGSISWKENFVAGYCWVCL